jgi:hypothetical protein
VTASLLETPRLLTPNGKHGSGSVLTEETSVSSDVLRDSFSYVFIASKGLASKILLRGL